MVYLALKAHPALRQGLFVQGEITLTQQEALSVPQSAVTRESGHDQVLRVRDGKVGKVDVKLGSHVGQGANSVPMVEITEGLQAGERVLINASGTVRDGQAVAPDQASPASAAATR